jgi:hypothetical protein
MHRWDSKGTVEVKVGKGGVRLTRKMKQKQEPGDLSTTPVWKVLTPLDPTKECHHFNYLASIPHLPLKICTTCSSLKKCQIIIDIY